MKAIPGRSPSRVPLALGLLLLGVLVQCSLLGMAEAPRFRAGLWGTHAWTYLPVRAVAADPGYPRAWLNLGMELERAGSVDSALVAYRIAVQRDSTSIRSMNHLAGLLLRREETQDEGYAWIERSLAVDPGQAEGTRMRDILRARPRAR